MRISLILHEGAQATLGISREILEGAQNSRGNFFRYATISPIATPVLTTHFLVTMSKRPN